MFVQLSPESASKFGSNLGHNRKSSGLPSRWRESLGQHRSSCRWSGAENMKDGNRSGMASFTRSLWDSLFGCGSILNHRGTADFSPCVHLPGFHFGYLFSDPQPFFSMGARSNLPMYLRSPERLGGTKMSVGEFPKAHVPNAHYVGLRKACPAKLIAATKFSRTPCSGEITLMVTQHIPGSPPKNILERVVY